MLYIVFPFEIPFFTKCGIPFVYKGNPLVEAVENYSYVSVCDGSPYVALLPGSRKAEISRTMPLCMELADRMHADERFREYKFIVAGAPSREESDYAAFLDGRRDYVSVVYGQTYSVLKGAKMAVVNSGTASLEAALIGTPQMVCWSTSPLTAYFARNVLHVMDKIKYVSLGNLIVDSLVFKEFIQEDFNIDNLWQETLRILEDGPYTSKMLQGYAQIKEALGQGGASRAYAQDMIARLKG